MLVALRSAAARFQDEVAILMQTGAVPVVRAYRARRADAPARADAGKTNPDLDAEAGPNGRR